MSIKPTNTDANVVRDFGSEWSRFDQSRLLTIDLEEMFEGYFHIFPWDSLSLGTVGADIGCGTRLGQRFSPLEIKTMLQSAGFTDIRFSDTQPFWCAVGIKRLQ